MRVNDDLDKNISSFYGEILKIKKIVTAVDVGEKVIFLLDEIFKGTNSIDRHAGAEILIRQLSLKGSIGLVSTHDLELSSMEKEENAKVINYHFEEYYKDDKIFFDYKLKRGVSTTRNAIFLMRLAGININ
jgi:DNA mismatch repair ATPase MutS